MIKLFGWVIQSEGEYVDGVDAGVNAEAACNNQLTACEDALTLERIGNNALQTQAASLTLENESLKSRLQTDLVEDYYDSTHSKTRIDYGGRISPVTGQQEAIDVRYWVPEGNGRIVADAIQLLVQSAAGKSNDEKMAVAFNWVTQNFSWTPDSTEYKQAEYWATIWEMLDQYRVAGQILDDCDGGAIAMYNVALALGVPYYRMRVNAGLAGPQQVGHCYLSYCRETDNYFVVMDWCLNPSQAAIKDRPRHKDSPDYHTIWFSFNSRAAYSDADYTQFDGNKVSGGE